MLKLTGTLKAKTGIEEIPARVPLRLPLALAILFWGPLALHDLTSYRMGSLCEEDAYEAQFHCQDLKQKDIKASLRSYKRFKNSKDGLESQDRR